MQTNDNDKVLSDISQLIEQAEINKLSGEFLNIPNEVYHHAECPGYSRSDLTTIFTRSFEHLIAKKQTPQEKSKPLEFGSAFHDLMQGEAHFLERHICSDDMPKIETPKFGRTKADIAAKETWRTEVLTPFETDVLNPWLEKNKNKTKWDIKDWEHLNGMGGAIKNHETVQLLLKGAEFENTYFWRDDSGILLKAKIDAINKELDVIIDFKSTFDASPTAFAKSIANYFYDVQAAIYLRAVERVLNKKFLAFVFVAVEKTPPYSVAIYSLDEEAIAVGREISQMAIDKIKLGAVGYPKEVQGISLPRYAFNIGGR